MGNGPRRSLWTILIKTKQFQPDGSIQTKELQLAYMTMLDPVTGWFEIVKVPNQIVIDIKNKMNQQELIDKSSAHISCLFDQTWLARYLCPKKVVFDNGSKFKKDFVSLLKDWPIKPKCTTINNPQSNSPVERFHQVLRHMFVTKNLHKQIFDYIDPFGSILASVAWVIRALYNSATDSTPAQLVFGQDMMFNLKSLINWKEISMKKQTLVDKANLRENQKCIDYDYQVDDPVQVIKDGIYRKLDAPKFGPFCITDVYTNGTVRVQHGNVNERFNIRRLEPHFE